MAVYKAPVDKMKLLRQVLTLCVFLGAVAGAGSALAADKPPPKDLFLKGDGRCTACHDEADGPELLRLGKTKHGTQADGRTPTCTSCHGDGEAHIKDVNAGVKKPTLPPVTFGPKSLATPEAQNGACLACHQKDAKRSHWEGSIHQARDVKCTSCHQLHVAQDKVRDKRTQPEVCFTCHKEQRAQVSKPSHHPILEGKVACSDCHNPHGSVGPKLMKRDSVNETCYTCHMEKRGPFVHNHEPVSDDCTNCHNPHGTVTESMLKMRPPFLCQSCHTPHGATQPLLAGQVPAPNVTGWWNGSAITQGRGCLNCHTQIHGSNSPSATNPMPQLLFR